MILICSGWLAGCSRPGQSPEPRQAEAKQLFEHTVKNYHLPSAEAQGAAREKLLQQAAAGYETLLRNFADQTNWCAQALRSLANVKAAQGRLDEATRLYKRVETQYRQEDWEVLQAWKSAGDLLWDARREEEARGFYRKIVERFDRPNGPAVIQSVVRGAQSRLSQRIP